ncbi:MAG TPA: potassium/proton antiporter [Xanthobacteraceae bacterium]|nr:potassium/proton antiporter [Xanthobacteraceae bacterium]
MGILDAVNLAILLGATLMLAGILSSLVALRFGAPLLLMFLAVGMLAGEAGPGGIKFDDVRSTYLVGSIALALILFDGGLRTRINTFRTVLAPSVTLATIGVLLTALFAAPFAKLLLGIGWTEAVLVGAVVASTDAAAVFFLLRAHGLRLRPRVAATLEVESGTNDPFAIFLAIVLVEILLTGDQSLSKVAWSLFVKAVGGGLCGWLGGRVIVFVTNRVGLSQGLHPIFVATAAVVVFGLSEAIHASGFLAVYIAGLVFGNQPTRAHSSIIVFLDAVTWLAQIVMFMLLGLLVWPDRLIGNLLPALGIAAVLMLIARPAATMLCLWPFRFSLREKLFISWVGLRGAVGIFLASIPLLVSLPNAQIYFDVGFVVVLVSLLVQGWSIAYAAHRMHVALPDGDPDPHRVELDLPGQLAQELVGYTLGSQNPYLRHRLIPSWAKLMMVVRKQQVLTAEEAGILRETDHVYLLAPPERAPELDRFFVDHLPAGVPDQAALVDFLVPGDAPVSALAEVYGQTVGNSDAAGTIADYFAHRVGNHVGKGDMLPFGAIVLIANQVTDGRVVSAGLRLTQAEPTRPVLIRPAPIHRLWRRVLRPARNMRRRQRPPQ